LDLQNGIATALRSEICRQSASAVQCSAAQRRREREERERDRNKELGREQGLGRCLYEGNGKKIAHPNSKPIHPSMLRVFSSFIPFYLFAQIFSSTPNFLIFRVLIGVFIIIENFIKRSI
jgi:hypothetical protein